MTTDTLALYAALHADVPETKPEGMAYDSTTPEALALCRCAALEWACKENPAMGFWNDIESWCLGGASDDSRLIDICRAIHAVKEGSYDHH